MNTAIRCLVVCLFIVSTANLVKAQQRFQLRVPGSNVFSSVEMRGNGLVITDQSGGVSRYVRDPRFDSDDRRFLGFYDDRTQQVLQWPSTNQGNFRIGRASAGGWIYTNSQMVIQSDQVLPPQPNLAPPLPGVPPPNAPAGVIPQEIGFYRLTSIETAPFPAFLDSAAGVQIQMAPRGREEFQAWRLIPVVGDVVRIEGSVNGYAQSLATQGPLGPIILLIANQSQDQLWRCLAVPGQPRAVWFESVAYPGQSLTGHASGIVELTPYVGLPSQQWYLESIVPAQPYLPPIRSVSKSIAPNPPLPAAEVQLVNPTKREIILLLGDRRKERTPKQIRIPAQGQVPVSLDRDAGGQLVEVYETRLPDGSTERSEFSTLIPPSSYYDISVYELALKSIAIDRTGKSPNPIEDVNYSPKSIGWFQLPAGSQLQSGELDVFTAAKQQNNPGGVRPLLPQRATSESKDVLQEMLDNARGTSVPPVK